MLTIWPKCHPRTTAMKAKTVVPIILMSICPFLSILKKKLSRENVLKVVKAPHCFVESAKYQCVRIAQDAWNKRSLPYRQVLLRMT